VTTSLHDLRGMARAAQKRMRRGYTPFNYDKFEDAAIRWHRGTIRSYGRNGEYWRRTAANLSCSCCDLEEDVACVGCEAICHWYGRDEQAASSAYDPYNTDGDCLYDK
jgi:hypothetical protein